MHCRRYHFLGSPALTFHRWFCKECRDAMDADNAMSRGISQMRAELAPSGGPGRALRALQALGEAAPPQVSRNALWNMGIPTSALSTLVQRQVAARRIAVSKAVVILSALLPTVGFCVWRLVLDEPTLSNFHTPTLPAPNGFDFAMRAGGLIVDEKGIKTFVPDPRMPGDLGETPLTVARQQAFVRANLAALKEIRKSFTYRYQEPFDSSWQGKLVGSWPNYEKMRSIAKILTMEARLEEFGGNWSGAMESVLDIVHLGEELPHGSQLNGWLAGIAIEGIGIKEAWRIVPHLTGEQARIAARQLKSLERMHVTASAAIQQEKWDVATGMLQVLNGQDLRQFAGTETPRSEKPMFNEVKLNRLSVSALVLYYGRSRIIREFLTSMDRLSANADIPYATRPSLPEAMENPINRIIIPIYMGVGFMDTSKSQTEVALLTTALQLRAFRSEHGMYPSTLYKLVPNYAAQLPRDPFAKHGTFGYRRTGKSYILYSVGPDGKDNGGKPVFNPSNGNTNAYRATADSVGDIVAGLNY